MEREEGALSDGAETRRPGRRVVGAVGEEQESDRADRRGCGSRAPAGRGRGAGSRRDRRPAAPAGGTPPRGARSGRGPGRRSRAAGPPRIDRRRRRRKRRGSVRCLASGRWRASSGSSISPARSPSARAQTGSSVRAPTCSMRSSSRPRRRRTERWSLAGSGAAGAPYRNRRVAPRWAGADWVKKFVTRPCIPRAPELMIPATYSPSLRWAARRMRMPCSWPAPAGTGPEATALCWKIQVRS